jgi:hypothetical protein
MAERDVADREPVLDIADRVRRLEAQGAVADLIHRYALAVRSGRPQDCAALFTQDGSFEIRDASAPGATDYTVRARLDGRDAVMAYVGKSAGSGLRVLPMIRNILVHVEGRTATSTSLMDSRTWPAGGDVIGEYQDSFREEDGMWLFSGRIFTIFARPEG